MFINHEENKEYGSRVILPAHGIVFENGNPVEVSESIGVELLKLSFITEVDASGHSLASIRNKARGLEESTGNEPKAQDVDDSEDKPKKSRK